MGSAMIRRDDRRRAYRGEKGERYGAGGSGDGLLRQRDLGKEKAGALGIEVTTDNRKVAEFADILFLAVKPNLFESVIPQIAEAVTEDMCVVSIAAGADHRCHRETVRKEDPPGAGHAEYAGSGGEAMSALSQNDAVTGGGTGGGKGAL